MADLHEIQAVVARVRRRLRLQGAIEAAATAAILAVAAALVVLWCWRMELVARPVPWLVGTAGLVALGAAIGAARRLPAGRVAARIDRASGLADRLGTALDFENRTESAHPDTQALMRAAIADGIRAVPRADVKASAPLRAPRDARALAAFSVVGAALALLSFGPTRSTPAVAAAARPAAPPPAAEKEGLDPEDVAYQKEFVQEMKQLAEQTQDESLQQMAKELQDLLDKAEKGQISKQELLGQMDALEKKYSDGTNASLDKTLADLKDQGKELQKNAVTKRLGDAMEKGDMEAARKELERLADEVEKGELKPEEQKKLAEALAKAAEKQEQKQQKEDKKDQAEAQKQIEKKKDEIRKLQKKVEQQPKDEQAKRTLEKEQRELDKLQRDQKDKQEQKKTERQLDRLSRNLKQAAENLQQKKQKESAQNMRQGAEDTKKIQSEMKKQSNQQRVRSQMQDLKDAIRRAKPQKSGGKGSQQMARMKRVQEWERRAGGQQGNPQAWKSPGQGQPGQQGDKGDKGEKGDQPGEQWGTEHDPNLTGDPTRMDDARFKADELRGQKGQGPSRRETIVTSAQKGFARTGYRQIYADYKKIVEEVINQEKVPQGYKYYVKRYFERIKPHSMD